MKGVLLPRDFLPMIFGSKSFCGTTGVAIASFNSGVFGVTATSAEITPTLARNFARKDDDNLRLK